MRRFAGGSDLNKKKRKVVSQRSSDRKNIPQERSSPATSLYHLKVQVQNLLENRPGMIAPFMSQLSCS